MSLCTTWQMSVSGGTLFIAHENGFERRKIIYISNNGHKENNVCLA